MIYEELAKKFYKTLVKNLSSSSISNDSNLINSSNNVTPTKNKSKIVNMKSKTLNLGKTQKVNELTQTKKTNIKHNLIDKPSISKSPSLNGFDGLATKRKNYSISYLIKKSTIKENVARIEKNKLFKKPYPLLYFISNRKFGNSSSNLIADILNGENGKLTCEQINTLKNTVYSNNDILKIKIKNYNKGKNLKSTLLEQRFNKDTRNKNNQNISNLKEIRYYNSNANTSLSRFFNHHKKSLPLLNKFIKNRVINIDYIKKPKIKRSSSCYSSLFEQKSGNKNKCEVFKSKSVNLYCHKTNTRNISVINDRLLRTYDIYSRKNKPNQSLNEIIKDISLLKINNNLISFDSKINYL